MLVPDFMHEFELGVFKSFFIHLLHILYAHGNSSIAHLNKRFRLIPMFDRSTIRRFMTNMSALKKMAAWNYQCIFLCAMPVVEGLLPEPHNSIVLDVLFMLAEFHTLAKLKMHTDLTIEVLRSATKEGELEHQHVKHFYIWTNKNRAAKLNARLFGKTVATPNLQGHRGKTVKKTKIYVPFAESEALPYTSPEQHHHISGSHNFSLHLPSWLAEHHDDPAVENFLPKLQEHVLSRLSHPERTGNGNEFTLGQRYQLALKNQRIYRHKILRINYTSYDMQRGQDCLNPHTHSDVMTLAPEDDTNHPFLYAQILGIFHADVVDTVHGANPKPQAMDFLWLFCVEFLPDNDPNAFGFLNPDEVIRGAHLIPAFAQGKTKDLLATASVGRLPSGLSTNEDWRYYYVNFFVDRGMYMRYLSSGVGHYQVEIPPEDDAEADNAPAPAPDSDKDEFPPTIPLPQAIPPPSPEAAAPPLPEDQEDQA
ncbi:hypothetical protein MSAN_00197100 [Mycena sanguinolenta]|uniref:Uncharacterized protein n=1 Tax=Mycena sanguinolenta TaxID=230812 RepID=A0A8H7DNK4_9AGAR|nr:hypothetical protein MSAN_00197100 [Mycena sanguinolenta]